MFSRLIGEMGKTKLADASKALKLCGIDQPCDQIAFRCFGIDPDYVVNRVAVNSFRQIDSPLGASF